VTTLNELRERARSIRDMGRTLAVALRSEDEPAHHLDCPADPFIGRGLSGKCLICELRDQNECLQRRIDKASKLLFAGRAVGAHQLLTTGDLYEDAISSAEGESDG